jgi:hypothetical protein
VTKKKIIGNSNCGCAICEDLEFFEDKRHPCDFFIPGGIYCKFAYIICLSESQ